MTSTVSRRTFLRQTASASAVAAAGATMATTVAGATGAAHPDAALFVLEAEFNRLLPIYEAAENAAHAAQTAFFASGGRLNTPAALADYLGRHSEVEAEHSRQGETLADAERAIIETPAATLAGLAVKARFLRYQLGIEENPSPNRDDWTMEQDVLHDFIAEVERMVLAGRA